MLLPPPLRHQPRKRLAIGAMILTVVVVSTFAAPRVRAQEVADPAAGGGVLHGPSGPGHLGGPPAEQELYSPLRRTEDAARIWEVSERLTGTEFPTT